MEQGTFEGTWEEINAVKPCDAGPPFALADPRQAVLHRRRKAALSHLRSPLVPTWPSFTEAIYPAHRPGGWPMQNLLWRYVREAVLVFHELGPEETNRLAVLMEH